MATIRFSTLTNNQTIAFNPATDVLQFDNVGISAGSVILNYSALNNSISFTVKGKTFFLPASVLVTSLTTSNVKFADGSQLLIGTTTADNLVGTNFGDYITGLAGAENRVCKTLHPAHLI